MLAATRQAIALHRGVAGELHHRIGLQGWTHVLRLQAEVARDAAVSNVAAALSARDDAVQRREAEAPAIAAHGAHHHGHSHGSVAARRRRRPAIEIPP